MTTNQRTVSNKIAELMKETETVLSRKATKPKELIEIGKLIEKSEKSIRKEHRKLIEIALQVNFEITEIQKFAEQMGYALSSDESTEEEPSDESSEETQNDNG